MAKRLKKKEIPYDLKIPFLHMYQKELEAGTDLGTLMFTAVLFTTDKG